MARIFFIGLAGALGTLARYFVSSWAARTLGTAFPYGTLMVNVFGCFLIALVSQLALTLTLISPTLRFTLTTGFIGGLTTYSSFNQETTSLLRDGSWVPAVANVLVTLVSCFVAGGLGLLLARRLVHE